MVLPGGQVQRRQAVGGQRVDGSTVKQQEMCQILSEKHPVVEGRDEWSRWRETAGGECSGF